jgi:hypothetical protein
MASSFFRRLLDPRVRVFVPSLSCQIIAFHLGRQLIEELFFAGAVPANHPQQLFGKKTRGASPLLM